MRKILHLHSKIIIGTKNNSLIRAVWRQAVLFLCRLLTNARGGGTMIKTLKRMQGEKRRNSAFMDAFDGGSLGYGKDVWKT